MALQMSAQEAQAAATAAAASGEAAPGAPDAMDLDEDALLQRAIELSRGDQAQGGAQGGTGSAPAAQQGSAVRGRPRCGSGVSRMRCGCYECPGARVLAGGGQGWGGGGVGGCGDV